MSAVQNAPDSQNIDTSAEHGEQDADDEAAEDTDDTRSVTFSVVVAVDEWCWHICVYACVTWKFSHNYINTASRV